MQPFELNSLRHRLAKALGVSERQVSAIVDHPALATDLASALRDGKTPNEVFVPGDSLMITRDAGGIVLLDVSRDAFWTLDEVGTEVWTQIEAGKSYEEIVQHVHGEFDEEISVVRNDVANFIANLSSLKLIVRRK